MSANAADCASLGSRVTGECVVNQTDAAAIRLTGVGMEGKNPKLEYPAAKGIRRNTPRGYSDLQGLLQQSIKVLKSLLETILCSL